LPKTFIPDGIATYRFLRIIIVVALVMLAASVVIQTGQSDWCWLGSVSAYYYTPVRAVFVGSLFAFGAALVAYQGHSREEDAVLNLAGFTAVIIAIVPTGQDHNCTPPPQTPAEIEAAKIEAAKIVAAVTNNTWSLVVAGIVLAVLLLIVYKDARSAGDRPVSIEKDAVREWEESALARRLPDGARRLVKNCLVRLLRSLVVASWLVPGLELFAFLFVPDEYIARSHAVAAVTMVLGLVIVMLISALTVDHQRSGRRAAAFRWTYRILALLLLIAVVAAVALVASMEMTEYLILVLEFVILAIFVVYWLVQSAELREGDDAGGESGGDPAPELAPSGSGK